MKLRVVSFLLPLLASLATLQAASFAQEGDQDARLAQAALNREVLQDALAKAHANNQRVLVIWAWKGDPEQERFSKWLEEQPEVARKLLFEYREARLFSLPREGSDEPGGGLDLNRLEEPTLTVFDAKQSVLANQAVSHFRGEDGDWDSEKLLAWLEEHQAEPWKAEERLAKAIGRARAANKRLFVTFGAPWCGWCHRLEDHLAVAEVHERMDADFDILKIDIEREVGGREVMKRYRGVDRGGIPWFVILAKADEVVATSEVPGGDDGGTVNLGCPYTDEELAAFGEVLRKASVHMDAEDIQAVLRVFKPKKAPKEG